MFEIVHFSVNIISKTCIVVFNVQKFIKTISFACISSFSIQIISNTCTVVFNVPKFNGNHLICLNSFILVSKSSPKLAA